MIQEEGPGWRLARDPSRDIFPIIIGGKGWAIELTDQEWTSLVPMVTELVDQHSRLKKQLMPEETLCLELERKPWWGCLDGDIHAWSLQIVLEGDSNRTIRAVEASWPFPAAQSFVYAMRTMWDSYH